MDQKHFIEKRTRQFFKLMALLLFQKRTTQPLSNLIVPGLFQLSCSCYRPAAFMFYRLTNFPGCCWNIGENQRIEDLFVALSGSARWVRSTLLSFCTVHFILSSAAVDLSQRHRENKFPSGMPRIKPGAAGCESAIRPPAH